MEAKIIRVEKPVHSQLKKIAKEKGMKLSSMVNSILKEWLKEWLKK